MSGYMKPDERYMTYKDDDFDALVVRIKNGSIKSGKYSGIVKIKKNFKFGKELFSDGKERDAKDDKGE